MCGNESGQTFCCIHEEFFFPSIQANFGGVLHKIPWESSHAQRWLGASEGACQRCPCKLCCCAEAELVCGGCPLQSPRQVPAPPASTSCPLSPVQQQSPLKLSCKQSKCKVMPCSNILEHQPPIFVENNVETPRTCSIDCCCCCCCATVCNLSGTDCCLCGLRKGRAITDSCGSCRTL